MNAPSPAISSSIKANSPRFGLIRARVGSNHMVKGKDGVLRSYTVRDIARHSREPVTFRCLACNVECETESELIEMHPDSAVLERQQERHVYAAWSEKKIADPETVALVKARLEKAKAKDLEQEIPMLTIELKRLEGEILGLLSNDQLR